VVGLVWSNDPESYAGGSVATGKPSHATQVKDDDPYKKGYPIPPGWGFGMRLTTSTHKIYICLEASKTGNRMQTTAQDWV